MQKNCQQSGEPARENSEVQEQHFHPRHPSLKLLHCWLFFCTLFHFLRRCQTSSEYQHGFSLKNDVATLLLSYT